ncbi:hypothetical protein JTB14_035067 [Gonioctena quinquepunctata]|nr:hypothetical protein JTB14_035067 [Gonioctena quinquepunctata]
MSNQEVSDLVGGIHSRTMHAEHVISDRKKIEEYIMNTLIFSMQSLQWYGKFIIDDPGMTIDNNNKYIGIARLRQHRSNNHSCSVSAPMRFIAENCISSFDNGPEFGDFSEGWNDDAESDKFARMDWVWKYMTHQTTGTFQYMGKFSTYPGGGYVATLGRTLKNSLINAEYLFRNEWIDRYTRFLSIEFLLYSPNSNLFHSVTVRYELGISGYVRTKYRSYLKL